MVVSDARWHMAYHQAVPGGRCGTGLALPLTCRFIECLLHSLSLGKDLLSIYCILRTGCRVKMQGPLFKYY